ncbi:MAG: branched-chain amino acid ABC transporter permease, partial [Alphaproteobacteria bacterium]|nr:branched-chain amino acid ABC transporter permease [Alphaproteobacteria bacterium]
MINRETGTFKRSFGEDLALYRVPLPRIVMTLIVLWVFVGFPLVGSEYWLGMANLLGIACLGALGLNILIGYTGQISVGHAAFMSVGAYSAAVLMREFDMPWVFAMIGGGCSAAIVGMF